MATIYYTASSIDGFIATEDHSLDWLLSRDVDQAGPMGYAAFEAGVGALLMGAGTYRWVLEHGLGEDRRWPYELPCWVLTHGDPEVVHPSITVTDGPVRAVHAAAATAAGGRDVWVVGGGDVAGQLAEEWLLDEVWVQYAPVSLGSWTCSATATSPARATASAGPR
jgi:dihydrofolate reductase